MKVSVIWPVIGQFQFKEVGDSGQTDYDMTWFDWQTSLNIFLYSYDTKMSERVYLIFYIHMSMWYTMSIHMVWH